MGGLWGLGPRLELSPGPKLNKVLFSPSPRGIRLRGGLGGRVHNSLFCKGGDRIEYYRVFYGYLKTASA